jgi:hypothetical protein
MITLAFAFAAMVQDAPSAASPAPPGCDTEEHAAFDFWVGEWDVFRPDTGAQVARSRIERVSAGCAIRETWMPLQGGYGSSLSTYDPATGTWHQLWVGPTPGRVFFEGGIVDGAMVLTGYWGSDPAGDKLLIRMTYTLADDGSVRQYGQQSADHGRSWSDSFDLTYRPRTEGAEE